MPGKPTEAPPELHAVESAKRSEIRNRDANASPLCNDDPPDSLEKRIRRNPNDLTAHFLRIQYYQTQFDGPGCFAAIVDLFIVLGSRGTALRRRMLDQCAFLLTRNLRNFLESHMETGISPRAPLPCLTPSILTEAISGTTELFTKGAC